MQPISPRSLSFRPILLPKDARVEIAWNVSKSEDKAWMARALFDGDRYQHTFGRDSRLSISMSPYPLLTINRSPSDWIRDLQQQLQWNKEFQK